VCPLISTNTINPVLCASILSTHVMLGNTTSNGLVTIPITGRRCGYPLCAKATNINAVSGAPLASAEMDSTWFVGVISATAAPLSLDCRSDIAVSVGFGELLAESSNWRAVSSNWWSRESRVLMMCNSMLVDGITMQATAMNLTFHPLDQTPN